MAPTAEELVLALCHEVGNLLAAIRLESALERSGAGERSGALAARAGALVALVRPLLAGTPAESIEAAGVIEGLRRALDEPALVRVEWDGSGAAGAWLRGDGEALRHLLLAELLARLGELAAGERVRVAVESGEAGVALRVESPGAAPPEGASGRGLPRALAERLLPAWGGRVETADEGGSSRLTFVLEPA